MEHLATVISIGLIAAAIAVLTGLFTAVGQGKIAASAIESIARQPEAAGSIRGTMILGLAMAETAGIYGLLVSIIVLFVFVFPVLQVFLQYVAL